MDSRVEEIIEGFKRHLKGVETSFIATVEEDKKTTVDVKDFNGTLYPDVRKIATENAKGFVPMLPKNSYVIVSRISKSDDLFISMMSEIEGLALDVNDTIIVNEGKNTTAKADILKKELEKMSKRIDGILDSINSATVVATPQDGGTAFLGFFKAAISLNVTNKENFSEIENEKIKH